MSGPAESLLLGIDRPLVGVIHLRALPRTPAAKLSVEQVVQTAVEEGELYRQAGFDALIVENLHDRPYLRRRVGPEVGPDRQNPSFSLREAVSDQRSRVAR